MSGYLAGLCSEFHEAKIKKLGELRSLLEALGEDLFPEPVKLLAESSFFFSCRVRVLLPC